MLANVLANCGNSCNMHRGYEYVESERDDVNGLPDLWDIDRLARYLSVSKHFVYPPLLPPSVRPRATRGGHQPAFWRDAAGRQRTKSFDTAAEADAADQRSRGTRDGRYRRPNWAQASQRLVAEMDGSPRPRRVHSRQRRIDPDLPDRTGVREDETSRAGLRRSDIAR